MGADEFKKSHSEVKRQKEKGSICFRFGKKLFNTMYPAKKKVVGTK